jgi:hypothetical protein
MKCQNCQRESARLRAFKEWKLCLLCADWFEKEEKKRGN